MSIPTTGAVNAAILEEITMGKPTGFQGPLVVYGERNSPGNAASDPDGATSLFYGGSGLFDSRGGYNQTRRGAVGFAASSTILALAAVPSTISAVAIAAAQVPVAGTKLTLVSATGGGITVISAANQPLSLFPSGNQPPIGANFIDGLPGVLGVGLDGSIGLWDPSTLIQRAVQITSVGNDSAATFLISGCDYGGYPITDLLTGANAGVVTSLKTFKAIYSITPAGTLSGSNVSVGQADVYQFPLLAAGWENVLVFWNGLLVSTASTGFTVPDTTAPATSATGDTRGKYAVQSASNNTKKLVMYVTPTPSALAVGPAGLNAALFGVTPA